MAPLSLSSSALGTFTPYTSSRTKNFLFAGAPRHQPKLLFHVADQRFNPLRQRLDKSDFEEFHSKAFFFSSFFR
jgi:hypothetical protein